MSYFACSYFDQTYFSTDCAPSGGRAGRGPRIPPRIPAVPTLDDGEELFTLF